MTIKNVIKELTNKGYNISFYKRKDGGIRITRINGDVFRGSKGNAEARRLTGITLSESQKRALSKLITPKGKGSYNKRRKPKLDKSIVRDIQRIQRLYRKAGKGEGMPTIRNYRFVLKEYGSEEARRLLTQSERRILGLAYKENVDWLLVKLQEIYQKFPSDKLLEAIKEIESKKDTFMEKWIKLIYELGTTSNLGIDIQAGLITSEELGESILNIIS